MPTVTKPTVTPLYAIAGAGDLAVEKIREYGDDLSNRVVSLKDQPKTVQTELTKQFEKLTADAKTVPAKLRELPFFVQSSVNTVLGEAEATYDELAGRGKKLVFCFNDPATTE